MMIRAKSDELALRLARCLIMWALRGNHSLGYRDRCTAAKCEIEDLIEIYHLRSKKPLRWSH